MRQVAGAWLVAVLAGVFISRVEAAQMNRRTVVSIEGQAFHVNGRPTYDGRTWQGLKIEGLLMNARLVQGIFDDRNPATRSMWNYPDGPWDPERNTREFLAAMPVWRRHGLVAFTINLQGGSPQGYSNEQPWHNSAFEADGALRADYASRLERILDRADELGMAVILGYFYFGQDERLADEAAVVRATETATDWVLSKGYTNVLIEINNECNVNKYDHEILKPRRVHELIELVKKRSAGKVRSPAGRLLTSASMGGGAIPPDNIIATADFILLHGNGVGDPARIRKMVDDVRSKTAYRGQPVLFNEDDHFDFDKPDNNMVAAVSRYAGWGYFDFRKKGESFNEGYQSVPVNWGISSERKRGFFGLLARMTGADDAKASGPAPGSRGESGPAGSVRQTTQPVMLDTRHLVFTLHPDSGRYEITDKAGGVTWRSNPFKTRFGQVTIRVDGKPVAFDLGACEAASVAEAVEAKFRPMPDRPEVHVVVRVAAAEQGRALDFSYEVSDAIDVDSIRLLDEALWTTDADSGCILVPVREGLLIPADGGKAFSHTFDTYAYEGCHMQMVGLVKAGAATLVTWDDCYPAAEVRSTLGAAAEAAGAKQILTLSMILRKSARACRVAFLGKGDCNSVGAAYREVARRKGYLVTWDEKLRGHADRAKYFGAVNFKLWSTLSRHMNEDSTREESVKVNWTFDEAAHIAEHLKNDLKLDRVLFIMGGWIRRGYDNQHPDILPTAPECGGDEAFARACRRIMALGYILSLHDNYQDIYRDSPSWDEKYVMKRPDGSLVAGGRWAGGRAYLTCSKMALELAKRPENLPAVKKLSDADSYFIDTTYAAGLQECFDPAHPLTRADDMKWKQALSDYARQVFGSFGSECGREWAVPHADFFEGLTGVSGTYFHDKGLTARLAAAPVPLFEMVYRDCMAMYGKYGYDIYRSAEYVLHHISIGRPLNYHSVPHHLYWKDWRGERAETVAIAPLASSIEPAGPRRFNITYRWDVRKPVATDWWVFVHFTDQTGQIKFQNDHQPAGGTSAWKTGEVTDGPHAVRVPDGVDGIFDVRVGLFSRTSLGRVTLLGEADGERRHTVGRIKVVGDTVEFTPLNPKPVQSAGDDALFTRCDGGWADRMHPMDVFVKNTYEVLSPLNELTSRVRLTRHEFLSADRKVRRTVFGEGADAEVIVNMGAGPYKCQSKTGGQVILPPYGFLVELPSFVAFCASTYGGLQYDGPVLFTIRSADGKPLAAAGQARVYHGFGDPRIRIAGAEHSVDREAVVPLR